MIKNSHWLPTVTETSQKNNHFVHCFRQKVKTPPHPLRTTSQMSNIAQKHFTYNPLKKTKKEQTVVS